MNYQESSYPSREIPHVGNRRREGYELARQRDMGPVALGAALAALTVHLAGYFFFPALLKLEFATLARLPEQVKDDVVRIVVKDHVEESFVEADVPEELETPAEVQEIDYEPAEIDILDMQVEELTMAPGETQLVVPEPEAPRQEATDALSEIPHTELDLSSLPAEVLPEEAMQVPEPTPINNNMVVAQASAMPDDVKDASSLMEKEMRKQAKESNAHLPGDTRSLSELISINNPGARSGVARLGTDVLFEFNQCRLKNSARITMLQLAALIQKNPHTHFIIEGHTDSIGNEEYNAMLSLQRAGAVREWLMKNHVPVKNVYLRASGSQFPLVSVQGSKEEQSLNRRVEIHMRKPGENLPTGCVPSTVEVDMNTPVATLLARGLRAPVAGKDSAAPKKADARPEPSRKVLPAAPVPDDPKAEIPAPVMEPESVSAPSKTAQNSQPARRSSAPGRGRGNRENNHPKRNGRAR